MELNNSNVIFDAESHRYSYQGEELRGITHIIREKLFPDEYKSVDEEILLAAARRGTEVHNKLFHVNNNLTFIYDDNLCEGYKIFLNSNDIVPLKGEYIITDFKKYASSIDMIDSNLNIYDYKTSSVMNEEYVRWQLSVYAYLFEITNPELKAGNLFGVHVKDGDFILYPVDRIDNKYIEQLLYGELELLPVRTEISDDLSRMNEMVLFFQEKYVVPASQSLCKKDSAGINKLIAAVDGKRLQIEREILASQDGIIGVFRQAKAVLNNVRTVVKERLSEYEQQRIATKRAILASYWNNFFDKSYEQIMDGSWDNKSKSVKAVKREIDILKKKINGDIALISDPMILAFYEDMLDISEAYKKANELRAKMMKYTTGESCIKKLN